MKTMKQIIDDIYSKCDEVGSALFSIVPSSFGSSQSKVIKDYPHAFNKFSELLNMVIDFSQNQWTVKGTVKKPNEIEIAIALLDKPKGDKPKQIINRLKYHIYQLGMFADKLLNEIEAQHSDHYETLFRDFMSDTQWLLAIYEYYCNIQTYEGELAKYKASKAPKPKEPIIRERHTEKRPTIKKWDLRGAINALFWMDLAPEIKDLPIRDLRPTSSLAMRQAIELIGKSAIGFESIVDRNGNSLKQFTQIAWKFIAEFKEKTPKDSNNVIGTDNSWKISFPLPIRSLELMNQWCNRYTHNPDNPRLYILWFVLESYWLLSKPMPHGNNFHIDHGDICIEGYKQMKREFEMFVARENSRAFVKWPEKVSFDGAWIIEEGEDPGPKLERKMRLRQSKKNLVGTSKAFWSELRNYLSIFFSFKK